MNVRITQMNPVIVQVWEEPDGVNPPNVVELVVTEPQGDNLLGGKSFMVELRHGNGFEFDVHEDDAESFPDTLFQDILNFR